MDFSIKKDDKTHIKHYFEKGNYRDSLFLSFFSFLFLGFENSVLCVNYDLFLMKF